VRKIVTSAKSREAQEVSKPSKARRVKKVRAHKTFVQKNPAKTPALAGVRPPPPGRGKRGKTAISVICCVRRRRHPG
jgi:hypothetical protein